MRILWITNILLPEAIKHLTGNDHSGSGGWLIGLLSAMSKSQLIEKIIVASVASGIRDLKYFEGNYADYYILPLGKGNLTYNSEYEKYWRIINAKEHPDIVHIHGTEFSHGLAYIKVNGSDNVLVSIQGLVSEIFKYSFFDIPLRDRLINVTLRSLLFPERKQYKKRVPSEIEYIKLANFFSGRTDWDKSHVFSLHPHCCYFQCGEILRDSFYDGIWDVSMIERHSIFISQANKSIKGLHIVLKALNIVKKDYPNVRLFVGGGFVYKHNIIRSFVRRTTFQRYIFSLIKKYNLSQNVVFLPILNEKEIKTRYLKSHISLISSSIENSSNSLAESQILGVPVISSFVGGASNMIVHCHDGLLYRYEEFTMLAEYIKRIFESDTFAEALSKNERKTAMSRHDKKLISESAIEIYTKVYDSCHKKNPKVV